MELRDAISQISEIHAQMARGHVFRGYRSVTAASSAGVAVITAVVQSQWLVNPTNHVGAYLWLWVAAAALGLTLTAAEMVLRSRRLQSPMQTRLTLLAAESFLPSAIAGGAVTYLIFRMAGSAAWILPPLWMIFFSLGIFATSRLLPRPTLVAGIYYMLAGIFCLVHFHGVVMFDPWIMGVVFGVGQMLIAAILFWTLERKHELSVSR